MAQVLDAKKGLQKLRSGDFNTMNVKKQPDGSEIITLSSDHYPEVYRFRVRNLYEKDEEVWDNATGKPIPSRDLR